jgi:hypothetical protein
MAAVPPATDTTDLSRTTVMVGLLRVSRSIVGMIDYEILTRLKSLADDARRAHNTKAGAPDNQFGVKLGDIRAMAKKINTDHQLALNLWDTGNVEAQLLATLIIKPKSLSADELDKLTRSRISMKRYRFFFATAADRSRHPSVLHNLLIQEIGLLHTPREKTLTSLAVRRQPVCPAATQMTFRIRAGPAPTPCPRWLSAAPLFAAT